MGDIEKWDQTDSPENPERGEKSESPASLQQPKFLMHCIGTRKLSNLNATGRGLGKSPLSMASFALNSLCL